MITEMVKAHSAFLEKFLSLALAEPDIDLAGFSQMYQQSMQRGLDGLSVMMPNNPTEFERFVVLEAHKHGAKHLAEMDDGK